MTTDRSRSIGDWVSQQISTLDEAERKKFDAAYAQWAKEMDSNCEWWLDRRAVAMIDDFPTRSTMGELEHNQTVKALIYFTDYYMGQRYGVKHFESHDF